MTTDEFVKLRLAELHEFFKAQFPGRHKTMVCRHVGASAYAMLAACRRRETRFTFAPVRRLEEFAASLGWRAGRSSEIPSVNSFPPNCPACGEKLVVVVTLPAAVQPRGVVPSTHPGRRLVQDASPNQSNP